MATFSELGLLLAAAFFSVAVLSDSLLVRAIDFTL
jgi:hypothetical protein